MSSAKAGSIFGPFKAAGVEPSVNTQESRIHFAKILACRASVPGRNATRQLVTSVAQYPVRNTYNIWRLISGDVTGDCVKERAGALAPQGTQRFWVRLAKLGFWLHQSVIRNRR